jgi:hypothetical protein
MKISIKLPSGNTIDGSIAKNLVTIGRSNKADFVVNDESLSRVHCQVDLVDGQFFITDLGSANGVYIDSTRLEANQKLPFSTFMQLMIGPLECSIQDDQGLQLDYTSPENTSTVTQITPSTTRDKKAQPSISKVKLKPKKKSAINPVALLVTLAVVLVVIYIATKKEDTIESSTEISEVAVTKTNKIQNEKQLVPNEFSSKDLYLFNEEKKSCPTEDSICSEFQLTSENQEGIFTQGVEVYIFYKPSKLFKQPHLAFLREKPDAKEVLSHFMVLSSSLMEQLESRKIEQIHLLMLDEQNQTAKVLRYHASQFEVGSNERFDLLESISSSIRAQNIKEIAQVLDLKIPSKKFD